MVLRERLYTAQELWAMSHSPEYQDKRLLLLEGILYVMTPTGWAHGDVGIELALLMRAYAKTHHLGRLTGAETGYRLAEETVLAPDIGFIAQPRIPSKLPSGYVPFAPDLAVEIVSPSNTEAEMTRKVQLYLRYGTRLVWVVDPELQTIQVYRSLENQTSAHVDFLSRDDTLTGGDILPGFAVLIRELFELEG